MTNYNVCMSSGIAFTVNPEYYKKIIATPSGWVKIKTTDDEWVRLNTNLIEYIDIAECDDGCEE